MISVEQLRKVYGTYVALADVSFSIAQGSVVGLLGRNGAGKTTTLRILAGVLRPSAGCVRFDGIDCASDPIRARANVAYLPESAPLYPELRVSEHLLARAAQKGLSGKERPAVVQQALSKVGATEFAQVLCGQLSRGMRQRVALADVLLKPAPLLLLDEPTTALDPTQTRETRELIRSLGRSSTVLVSTHLLAEVEAMCDSAIVMDRGTIIAQGSLEELRRLGRSAELLVTLRTSVEHAQVALSTLNPALQSIVELEPGVVQLTFACPAETDLDAFAESITQVVAASGIPLRQVMRKPASLEQIFADLTASKEVA